MTGATQRLSLTKPEDTVSNGRHDDGQQHFHSSSAVTAYFDRQGRLRSDITPAYGAAFRIRVRMPSSGYCCRNVLFCTNNTY
jgi:hypothetical protein